MPLQKIFAPHLPIVFSVVFLPHGIRVLAVYFLGWRGLIYLLPSSYPHVGNQRLWKFYRPNDFEPCGLFERGLCRCQNGQNI